MKKKTALDKLNKLIVKAKKSHKRSGDETLPLPIRIEHLKNAVKALNQIDTLLKEETKRLDTAIKKAS